MRRPWRALSWLGLCASSSLAAQDLQLHGYLDARLALPGDPPASWVDGGLGKARFGGDHSRAELGAAVAGHWQFTRDWSLVASAQLNPDTTPDIGVLDAYLRYRPVSTTRWRWSARVGAFFPPVSLENDGIGWTSRWTLTPSAINSWVGEELRSFGAELRLEHRGDFGTIDAGFTAFQHNDTAGELLASRGWALGDVTSALNARLRQPDVHAAAARSPAPLSFDPFTENDQRVGWHADMVWKTPRLGKFSLMRYDNRADPESYGFDGPRKVFSWRTRFWSLGSEFRLGDVVLVGQLMDGSTAFEPVEGLYLDTRFHAGYLLAALDAGNWRPALRLDMFSTRQMPDTLPAPLSEHGHAWTLALNWRPRPWLRATGELLRIDSSRDQRRREGLAPRQIDTRLQLSLRLLF